MHALLRRAASRVAHIPYIDLQRERLALRRVVHTACDSESLAPGWDESRLRDVLNSHGIGHEWEQIGNEIAALGITEKAAGVNPGDRRAVYHLVRSLAPGSVLEIGTHIGASTVHAAVALRECRRETGVPVRMTTVDIQDVNDPETRPWLGFGSGSAPKAYINRVGAQDFVRFVATRSLDYLTNARDPYDFIFLDGDHAARTVYREIPLALKALNRGGVILLHDYFPGLRPLWRDGKTIPGPWLATERLRAEGARIKVLPLGELPWSTKQNSNVTSLALLVGSGN